MRFSFWDVLILNHGLGMSDQPRPSARLITLTSPLIIPDIKKTSSNNCLLYVKKFDSEITLMLRLIIFVSLSSM